MSILKDFNAVIMEIIYKYPKIVEILNCENSDRRTITRAPKDDQSLKYTCTFIMGNCLGIFFSIIRMLQFVHIHISRGIQFVCTCSCWFVIQLTTSEDKHSIPK